MEISLENILNKKIYLDLNLALIQNLRFIHALMESKYDVVISKEDTVKFRELKKLFNISYDQSFTNSTKVTDFEISHDKPLTRISTLERNLIFPHSIVNYCKRIWKDNREYKCSFAGLITEKRKEAINRYIQLYDKGISVDQINKDSLFISLINKIKNRLSITPEVKQKEIGDIIFWSSTRGRTFPIKAWDDEYFQLLSNSKFILCPNGDFIWTYRFFESILCGAIPIIEDYCELYEGFRYKTFKDNLKELEWNQEDAGYNYELCVKRLTLPEDELNLILGTLINDREH